jgi:hypothetical protein
MRNALAAIVCLLAFGALAPAYASDPAPAVVEDEAAVSKLLGGHMLNLNWITWGTSGRVEIKEKSGKFYVKGMQKSQSGDYVMIDGWISHIATNEFTVNGTLVTKVATVNGGLPCGRAGEFSFAAKGKDKFWRLVDAENPCSKKTEDVLDIYFK